MLDKFGTDKPYKKAGQVTVPPNTKTTPAVQKKRPSVMDVRKLEATLQVAQEREETERKASEAEKKNTEMVRRAWEEIQEAERRDIMALRNTTAALRKEKETYEARYGILELRSLRDDNSVSTKSPRRHMSGSSETSQDFVEDILPSDFESVQSTKQKRNATNSYTNTPGTSRPWESQAGKIDWGYGTGSSELTTFHLHGGATGGGQECTEEDSRGGGARTAGKT